MTGLVDDEAVATGDEVLRTSRLTDSELYTHGAETLVASWEQYARGATGATLQRLPGVAAAVFPGGPERGIYNNALLARALGACERADAIAAMEAAYEAVGVTRFAAWVHESDGGMRRALERRGYTVDEVTRAMGMTLHDLGVPRPEVELGAANWSEHLPSPCGIYNVGTLEPARRRGLASALTAIHLHEARGRGCHTASLQSTATAERVYRAAGFRDLGRILEYVPPRR
jgi:ribosomal protein S18 acetylase RimI-like enzyme